MDINTAPQTYRLGSNAFVYAPGLIKWAINGYAWKSDQPQMIAVVASWGVPEAAAKALLSKQAPYTVEDEVVVFTA